MGRCGNVAVCALPEAENGVNVAGNVRGDIWVARGVKGRQDNDLRRTVASGRDGNATVRMYANCTRFERESKFSEAASIFEMAGGKATGVRRMAARAGVRVVRISVGILAGPCCRPDPVWAGRAAPIISSADPAAGRADCSRERPLLKLYDTRQFSKLQPASVKRFLDVRPPDRRG